MHFIFLISNIGSTRKMDNGYGLRFPAGCWVEVAELAAAVGVW